MSFVGLSVGLTWFIEKGEFPRFKDVSIKKKDLKINRGWHFVKIDVKNGFKSRLEIRDRRA